MEKPITYKTLHELRRMTHEEVAQFFRDGGRLDPSDPLAAPAVAKAIIAAERRKRAEAASK